MFITYWWSVSYISKYFPGGRSLYKLHVHFKDENEPVGRLCKLLHATQLRLIVIKEISNGIRCNEWKEGSLN